MTFHEAYAKAGEIIEQINDLIYGINSSKYGVTDLDLALTMHEDLYEEDGEYQAPTPEEIETIKAECEKNAQAADRIEELKQEYFDLTGVYPHYNGTWDWYERNYHEKIQG